MVFSVVVWICDFGERVVSMVDNDLHFICGRTIVGFGRWWQILSFCVRQNLIDIRSRSPDLLALKRKSVFQDIKGLHSSEVGFSMFSTSRWGTHLAVLIVAIAYKIV